MVIDSTGWTDKKKAIVRATIVLVAETGFAKVSTAKISKEAGVGEGTIYRHFQSKEEIFDVAAEMAAQNMNEKVRENYRPTAGTREQFLTFCNDFISCGMDNRVEYNYLVNYMNSERGTLYRRKMFQALEKESVDFRPLFYPLNLILMRARREGLVKSIPLQLLALQIVGQLVFVLRDGTEGVYFLDEQLRRSVAISCWDTVRNDKNAS